jgi:response regulator NasT
VRILIAEDDPVVALAVGERVRELGHEPIGHAANGREAVALARADQPDLYLFDVDMPELDGLAAAAQLAGEGLRRPTVVVTGIDDPGLVDRSVETGVSAYLTKPVDTRELDAAIRLAAARHAELELLESEVACTRQALADRKLVERAKGLLMSALSLSEQDAFARLQLAARERNLRLSEVARRVIEHQRLFEPGAPPPKAP